MSARDSSGRMLPTGRPLGEVLSERGGVGYLNPIETAWGFTWLGAWIQREVHAPGCTCSYHEYLTKRFGLRWPEASHGWRIVYWRRGGRLHVLRWTRFDILPRFRRTI